MAPRATQNDPAEALRVANQTVDLVMSNLTALRDTLGSELETTRQLNTDLGARIELVETVIGNVQDEVERLREERLRLTQITGALIQYYQATTNRAAPVSETAGAAS